VLRKILRPKGEEVRGYWEKGHNEEVHDLYSSLNITWVIKKKEMGGA
jgi:hypothetical protein